MRFFTALFGGMFLTLAAFLCGSELIVRTDVVPNDNFLHYAELVGQRTPSTVVLGDSRLANAFVGQPTLVNLAYPGSTVADLSSQFTACKTRRDLGLVVLQATPNLLVTTQKAHNANLASSLEEIVEGRNILFCLLPNYRPHLLEYWKMRIRSKPFLPRTPIQKFGGQLMDGAIDPDSAFFTTHLHTTLEQTVPPIGCSIGQAATDYRHLVEEIISQGAGIVLVSPPLYGPYFETASQDPGYQEAVDFFRTLSQTHRIPLLDHSGVIANPNEFHDSIHLNATGAQRYSKFLSSEIGSLGTSQSSNRP